MGGVMRKPLMLVAALATVATLGAGCSSDKPSDQAAPPATQPTSAAPTTADPTSAAPSSPAAPSSSPSAAPTTPGASPQPADDGKLKRGEKGAQIVALQTRLNQLGYWVGNANGTFGDQTQQGVYALQKAAGIGRDGVVGPQTQAALDKGVRPTPRSTSGYVIEIDLKKQIIMLVQDGKVSLIFNTATGSGKHYERDGHTYLATTPPGHFTVSRQIDGWRDAPLGLLWRPKYFNGGIAIHGSTSVPPYPASHGCARVSITAMNYLWTSGKIPLKTKVWVY
jgi:peptidoglycan hydrolase-like protein with peptidoglycan-binding domain